MDQINIVDLEIWARVGVSDEERANPQRLLLAVQMSHDLSAAGRRDDLVHTIDYFVVTQRLLAFARTREWRLIETLAAEVATLILDEFKPRSVTIEVKKFVIPQAQYVSVCITRPAKAVPPSNPGTLAGA